MPIEAQTYVALGARPKISLEAARSPRSLSDDGKALLSVDLAEVRHTPCPRGGRRAGDIVPFVENIEASQTELCSSKQGRPVTARISSANASAPSA